MRNGAGLNVMKRCNSIALLGIEARIYPIVTAKN
jgi:hypothetical protein